MNSQLGARLGAIVYLLVLSLTSAPFAQAAPGRNTLHFRTMGWGIAPDDLFYSMRGKDVSLQIVESGRSAFQAYSKRKEISFYRIVKKEDGTEERVIVAKGDLTGSGPTPLLIMTKSKAAPDQLSMTVIADDLTAFPERTCRFVNFTPLDIAVTVGRKAATIPRGGIQLVDTDLGKNGNTSYVTVFGMANGKKRMLSYNNWVFRPGQRVMVFISVDEKGQPRVIRLVDAVGSFMSLQNPADPP